ncbi:MAG: helix-turn-helix domain-containing protein [Coleofasciculaceae cyanobacterium SM2_1_6]|nr:helix-turn-helix domain-containing protein [Coleofasciculaceae cyanobacterium SM2_1_6]
MSSDSSIHQDSHSSTSPNPPSPHALKLKDLMHKQGITSLKSLAKATNISLPKIQQLRQGNVQKFRLEDLINLSQVLQIPLAELLANLGMPLDNKNWDRLEPDLQSQEIETLRREYSLITYQMREMRSQLLQEFQQNSLRTLETWLLQWQKIADHARTHPEFAAVKILPFIRPVEKLIESWGVEAIAPLGQEIPYDPQWHNLQAGFAIPGTLIKVISPGYRYQGKLLHRAEVALPQEKTIN